MAYEPPKNFPQHGGEGKGPYGAGWPDNELTTPNFRGRRLGEYNPDVYSPNYAEHTTTHVNPPADADAIGVAKHPFKLERYQRKPTDDEGKELEDVEEEDKLLSLRVYYGELWDTVSVISTEKVTVGYNDHFTIAGQEAIPGINRTVIPDFVHENDDDPLNVIRTTLKYAEFNEESPGDGNAYGTVILEWVVNADETAQDDDGNTLPIGVTDAKLVITPSGEEPEDDEPIEALAKDASELKRASDNAGIYRMVIGESHDMSETDDEGNSLHTNPIDQQVFDHVYWATTIVKGTSPTTPTTPTDQRWNAVDLNKKTTTKPKGVLVDVDRVREMVVINGNKNVQNDLE